MAKDGIRLTAEIEFIKNGLSLKEIGVIYHVSPNTLTKWAKEGNWKKRRLAAETGADKLIDGYGELLEVLVQRRLTLEKEQPKRANETDEERLDRLEYIQREKVRLTDEIAKINKAKESAEKESKISTTVYLEVMTNIFKALEKNSSKLYMQTLDFQREHVIEISNSKS